MISCLLMGVSGRDNSHRYEHKDLVLLGLSALSQSSTLSIHEFARDTETSTSFLFGCRPLSLWCHSRSEMSMITQIFLVAMLFIRQLCRKLA